MVWREWRFLATYKSIWPWYCFHSWSRNSWKSPAHRLTRHQKALIAVGLILLCIYKNINSACIMLLAFWLLLLPVLQPFLYIHDDVIKWNIFRITGHLCGKFTGHRWIPRTQVQWHGALMFSLICAWIKLTIVGLVIWKAISPFVMSQWYQCRHFYLIIRNKNIIQQLIRNNTILSTASQQFNECIRLSGYCLYKVMYLSYVYT